jgi:hypothetical protein
MSPKEKSEELYLKYKEALNIKNDMRPGKNPFAKECAIICVEQIIEAMNGDNRVLNKKKFWQEVLSILKNS